MAAEKSSQDFASLGLHEELVRSCAGLNWTNPTDIQAKGIPFALEGKDVIGLAETGSGKTAAFTLPILHRLLENPSPYFACILSPTRELAFQINDVVSALGSSIGTKTVCVTGGVDMLAQAIQLAKRPHIVVATPGRLVDHLEHTKGFNLRNLKVFVLDEADKMLSMDFETEINLILDQVSKERQTLLFSATMTKKVSKLQRASLSNPVKVSTSANESQTRKVFKTAKNLLQHYMFIPAKHKEIYLVHLLQGLKGNYGLIFASTCASCENLSLFVNKLDLDFDSFCLHGKMQQTKRLGALNKFKRGVEDRGKLLIATDVASRGLDIPNVDFVINFDVPSNPKDYVHRVGRTARAGKSGSAVVLVTQYDIDLFQRIENLIGLKLEELPQYKRLTKAAKRGLVDGLEEKVFEAQRQAMNELKVQNELHGKKKRRGQSRTRKRRRH